MPHKKTQVQVPLSVMDVDAQGVAQDPALDTTPLPADHTPKFLPEARSIYKDSRPPFVTNTSGTIEGSEREVFVANNGQRPVLPIRAKLVAKRWGPLAHDGIYWTLDLNGERVIVQSFPNKGCVSGAKWVYCCWTGVGENFEEVPLAFTCINGEYTYARGSKMGSAVAAAKRATTKTDASNSARANDHRHAHVPPLTHLDEDHPVEHLKEARGLYADSRPPFVVRRTKHPRRRVLLAAQDGRFSASSTEAEVLYRTWNSRDDYATLDLDGKRFIVMGNAGGPPGGYQYHLWLGPKAGRVKKVVAYCNSYAAPSNLPSGSTKPCPQIDEDSNLSSSSESEEDQDSEVSTSGSWEYRYDNFIKAFDVTATPPSAPSKFFVRRGTSSSGPSARKEGADGKSKSTKRARSPTPPAHFGPGKGKIPADGAERATPRVRQASNDSSGLSDAPYETPVRTPSANDRPAPTSETPNLQNLAPASLPTLTPFKQTHTTLRATRDSNIIGFVPLRLLSCMTMSTLFSSVIAASGHRECEEPIKCLMVVFDWKDDSDIYKTIYIDKGTQGSFEIFLEIIDEAPCWKEEGGKCGIAVEIVRA